MKRLFLTHTFAVMTLVVAVIACSPKSKPSASPKPVAVAADPLQPTEKDVTAGQQKYADLKLADLNAGYIVLQSKCVRCHKLYKPEEFSSGEWGKIIPRMAKKAMISDVEQEKLEKYIQTKKLS